MRGPISLGVVVYLAGTLSLGCDNSKSRFRTPVEPSVQAPVSPIPRPIDPPEPQQVTVGQVVEDRVTDAGPTCALEGYPYGSPCRRYTLTVPKRGTLVAEVRWDPSHTGTLLVLKLDEVAFDPAPPSWSPVVGRVPVTARQQVLLTVVVGGSDWFPDDPFTLTTAVE